jgi:proline utilization trans-activator
MINDEDVDAEKPSIDSLSKEDQEQFFEPDNLIANIKLAQISGQITNGISSQVNLTPGIYRIPKSGSGEKQVFVQSVHKVLNSLRSWGTTLPESLRLDYQDIPLGLKRPVATIHLAYNQVLPINSRANVS